ncbi:MAG: orotidine-5'-phosphate decarboxylase [Treponemataceae bacterium]
MDYLELLLKSADLCGNCACVGLDIVYELLPESVGVDAFIAEFLKGLKKHNLVPAAFKPNLAYFSSLNKSYEDDFSGYKSLSLALKTIRELFPDTPIILDAKRGDISTSSFKYSEEVFNGWQADATTVSPYMGHDSVLPFRKGFEKKGVYVLNRTSNKGASDLQNLKLNSGKTIYEKVAEQIIAYAKEFPGTGAVIGATSLNELETLAKIYANSIQVPLLIPGVGSQGGSADEVIATLKKANYDLNLVRINSSSGLTFPWKNTGVAPKDWLEACLQSVKTFLNKTKI